MRIKIMQRKNKEIGNPNKPNHIHAGPEAREPNTYPKLKNAKLQQVPFRNLAETKKSMLMDITYLRQMIVRLEGATQDLAALMGFSVATVKLTQNFINQGEDYKLERSLPMVSRNGTDTYVQVIRDQDDFIDRSNMRVAVDGTLAGLGVLATATLATLQAVIKLLRSQEKELIRFYNTLPPLPLQVELYPSYEGLVFHEIKLNQWEKHQISTLSPKFITQKMIDDEDKIKGEISNGKTAMLFVPIGVALLIGIVKVIQEAIASAQEESNPGAPVNNISTFIIAMVALIGAASMVIIQQRINGKQSHLEQFSKFKKQVNFGEGSELEEVRVPMPPSSPPNPDRKETKHSHPIMESMEPEERTTPRERTTPQSSSELARRKPKATKHHDSRNPKNSSGSTSTSSKPTSKQKENTRMETMEPVGEEQERKNKSSKPSTTSQQQTQTEPETNSSSNTVIGFVEKNFNKAKQREEAKKKKKDIFWVNSKLSETEAKFSGVEGKQEEEERRSDNTPPTQQQSRQHKKQ